MPLYEKPSGKRKPQEPLPTRENPSTPPLSLRYDFSAGDRLIRIMIDDADETARGLTFESGVYRALCQYEFPHVYSCGFNAGGSANFVTIMQLHRQCACIALVAEPYGRMYVIKETNIVDVCERIAKLLHIGSLDAACNQAAVDTANRRLSFPTYLGGK